MSKCTQDRIEFGKLGRRMIEADFSGGDLSSDGGMMLLKQVDERIGLTQAAAAVLSDPRDNDCVATSREKSYQPNLIKKNEELLSDTANRCYERRGTPCAGAFRRAKLDFRACCSLPMIRALQLSAAPRGAAPVRDQTSEPTTLVVFTLEEVEGGTLLTVAESASTRSRHRAGPRRSR